MSTPAAYLLEDLIGEIRALARGAAAGIEAADHQGLGDAARLVDLIEQRAVHYLDQYSAALKAGRDGAE